MLLQREREEIVRFGRKMLTAQLTSGTGGNLSIFNRRDGHIAISPSGIEYDEMEAADVPVVDGDGVTVDGNRKPSSELGFHLSLYRKRPDINAVVHTHSPYASTFAVLGQPIPACLTASAMLGGEIPLGGYAPIGGADIGQEIINKIGRALAIVMQNHGVFTIGSSPQQATKMAVEVEEIAKITHLAQLRGQPVALTPAQVDYMVALYRDEYGQH